MADVLLLPPVAFLVMLGLVSLHGAGFRALGRRLHRGRRRPSAAALAPYACGEDVGQQRVQPDYRQFFPFAFFFTIMHVVALIVTTLPTGVPAASALAAAFLVSAAVGVYVLFRR